VRRLGRLALVVAALLAAAAGALVVASRTRTVEDWVRDRLLAVAAAHVDGDLRIGRLHGTLGRSLVVEDLRVRADGHTVVHVPRLEIRYALLPLLRGVLLLRRVVLERPRIALVEAGGRWRLPGARASPPASGGREPRPVRLVVRRLLVHDGRIAVARDGAPRRLALAAVAADGAAEVGPALTEVRLAAFRAVPRGVAVTPLDVAGAVRVERGRVTATGLRVATARSRLTADGVVAPRNRVAATVTAAPLAAREVDALVPAVGLRTDVRAQVRADGPWDAVVLALDADLGAAGAVHGASRVDLAATPFAHRTRLRLTGLDPAALLADAPRARLDGSALVDGRGVGVTAPIAYELALRGSELEGHAIDALDVRGRARGAAHRARVRLALPAGRVAARVRACLGPPVGWQAAGRAVVEHVDVFARRVPGRARLRFVAAGTGILADDRTAHVDATLERGTVAGVALHGGSASARLAGDRLDPVRAVVDSAAGSAEARGRVDLARAALDARGTADVALAVVGGALGVPLDGRARLEATAAGPLDAAAVTARLAVEAPAAGAVQAERLTADLDATGLGGTAPRGELHVSAAGAALGLPGRQAVAARASWRRAAGTDRLAVTATARPVDGGAAAAVDVALERPAAGPVRGELAALELALPDTPPIRLVRATRFILDGGVRTDGAVIASGGGEVRLAGQVGRAGANAATMTLADVPLAPVCRLAGERCDGVVAGTIVLGGTAEAPRLDATLRTRGLRVHDVEYGVLAAQATYAERRLALHADLDHPAAGALRLEGAVPVDLAWAGARRDLAAEPVDLTLRASRLDLTFLRALAPGTLRDTAGRVAVDLHVTGPRATPRASGAIVLDGGRVELAATDVPWEDVHLRLEAAGTALRVVELRATGGRGHLTGHGTIGLADARAPALDLTVTLDEFLAFRRELGEAALSGELAVRGTVRAPELAGEVDVVHAVVRPAALPSTSIPMEPDPTILVSSGPDLPAPAPPAEPTVDPAAALRLGVTVRIARDAWIRRTDASIELGGRLRIEKEPDAPPRLVGEIVLLRGWYAFQGRRFTIDEGRIRFTGETPPEPTFDVTAVYATPGYRVTVRVEGTGAKPTLALSAEPPLSQTDILSVVIFGKPSTELGRGQSVDLQKSALQLASGYAMPELRTSVMNTFGLDTLDVDLPGAENQPGAVRVGRYVTSDVFVAIAQEFGTRAGQVVSLEYGLSRSLVVRGSTSTRGASAVDLLWRRRY
jgi:autotransporter translocation and assembly factor TamB